MELPFIKRSTLSKGSTMKKMNKKLALAVLTLGFAGLAPSVASADSCAPVGCAPRGCEPSCWEPCNTNCATDCCSFDVGIDVLYWKPCVDDLDFAAKVQGEVANIDNPLEVRYQSVCPEWEPGYRILLKKENAWKCFDLSLSYTWLNSDDAERSHAGNGERIAAVSLHPYLVDEVDTNNNFFDFARGKWELTYQTFDILLSYPFRCGSCHTVSPFFGVEVAKFDQEWNAKYEFTPTGTAPISVVSLAEWDSDYRGAGLKLGTDYNFLLCEGLSLFARASGTILIGDAKTHNEQATYFVDTNGVIQSSPNYIEFKDDDCCHVVPGCHLQLGLQYEDNTCGCEYKVRFGYEVVKWYNLQNPRRWFEADDDGQIAHSTQSNTTTLGFHGLLAGFEINF